MLRQPPRRNFPAPWTAEPIPGGWCVKDATGFTLVYVYGKDGSKGASETGMTNDDARRIAKGIARLPEFLGR